MSSDVISQVPTNVITGALGVGKTTFIEKLLRTKPEGERWAILVNEFGEVGIDGGLLNDAKQQDVFIAEVPGGCMCCTAGLSMQITLNRLIARAKPHRLIIEPTGLGHPAEVLATLQAPHYRKVIDVRATVTLVDARRALDSNWLDNPSYQEQMQVADIVIASKTDLYTGVEEANLQRYLASNNLSEKSFIHAFDWQRAKTVLDAPCRYQATETPVPAISMRSKTFDVAEQLATQDCVRLTNEGDGFTSFGWAMAPHRQFDFHRVLNVLKEVSISRLKAILITTQGIFAFNIVGKELSYQEVDESNDSRLEFISDDASAAKELAQQLEVSLFAMAQ